VRRAIITTLTVAALGLGAVGCAEDSPTTEGPGAGGRDDSPSAAPTSPSPSDDQTSDSPSPSRNPRQAPPEPEVAATLARDLTSPWGLAYLPDGSALVAERDTAEIKRVVPGGRTSTVGTVPGVEPRGEGGLLGLAVAPTFSSDRYVYAYFTAPEDNRIVRMRYQNSRLGTPEVVLDGIVAAFVHNGGRMVFGPDGYLYVGTGDPDEDHAQDRDSLGGKILRITPDGEPAPGNPFEGSPVWSYGHRNVQGLAFDPDGRLWASEFGQNTWDELNLIRKGGNYGWPEVEGIEGERGYIDPVRQWHTDDASPSGLAYADGALWMAALKGERLWRIQIRDGKAVGTPRAFFTGDFGRLRTVEQAPGGGLWLITNETDTRGSPEPGDDRVLRLRLTR
jgi:glucose/arabinose dehydrogenase